MPQSSERKRAYNRERQRLRRGYYSHSRRGGEYERGVVPDVVPPLIKGNVVPINPATMTKRHLVEYLSHVGGHGFSLVSTGDGYRLVAVGTGESVPFDAVAILEHRMLVQDQRILQLEADLARLDALISSMPEEKADATEG